MRIQNAEYEVGQSIQWLYIDAVSNFELLYVIGDAVHRMPGSSCNAVAIFAVSKVNQTGIYVPVCKQ